MNTTPLLSFQHWALFLGLNATTGGYVLPYVQINGVMSH